MNSKKKAIAVALIIIMSIVLNSSVLFAESNEASEELHIMDNYPGILFNGTHLIPLEVFFDTLGEKVEWDKNSNVITATYRMMGDSTDEATGIEKLFKFQINNKYALFDIREVFMKTPPVLYNEKVYIYAEAIAEEMGATVNTSANEIYISFPGTPTKSFVFPIDNKPDLSKLPKLPQPKIIDPLTTGDVSFDKKLDKDNTLKLLMASNQYPANDDWNYLKARVGSIFETISQNSDMTFTLVKDNVKDKCGNYLHLYMPLRKDLCEGIPNQNGEFAGWHQRQRIAGIVGAELAPIAKTIYLMCLNEELKPGLWEKYTNGIKITLVAANNMKLTVAVPFTSYKLGDTVMYRPLSDSNGVLLKTYKVFINGNYLGTGIDNNNWSSSFDGQIKKFLQNPVSKPLSPYFSVVNYPYIKSFYAQGIW